MKVRHAILMVLALAVLAGPLVGCRSSKKRAAQQPVAVQQAPRVVRAPSTSTYVTSRPPPPSAPPANWGSPDGSMAVRAPSGFPAASPSGFPGALQPATVQPVAPQWTNTGSATSAIVAERDSRRRIDQQIVVLEERLRETEREIARGNAPAASGPPSSGMSTPSGGGAQATRFASLMKAKALGDVEQDGSLVILRFSDAFQSGSEKLKKNTGLTGGLLAAANELANTPGVQIQVVGHSDGTPLKKTKKRWGTNVNLSRERAQTVATELSKHGVPASRIGVDGRGSVEPLVFPERTAKDRARNRRVEIHVRF